MATGSVTTGAAGRGDVRAKRGGWSGPGGRPERPPESDRHRSGDPGRHVSGAGSPLLVVDAANVVGILPDGWWRRRAEATRLLREALEPLAEAGLDARTAVPAWLTRPPLEVALVVEGAAARVAGTRTVRVIAARGSGDDAIVDVVAREVVDRRVAVVTSDHALRSRVVELGAVVVSPSALPRRPRLPERHI